MQDSAVLMITDRLGNAHLGKRDLVSKLRRVHRHWQLAWKVNPKREMESKLTCSIFRK